MKELTPNLFIIPGITLLFILLCYFYFARRTVNSVQYQNEILAIVLFGTILNAIWELAHAPLYKHFEYDISHIAICLLAALADMLMLLLLFFGLGLLYGDIHWIRQLSTRRIFLLVGLGGIGAIMGEMWHTGRGDWCYSEAMPLVPLFAVGIYPILQFMVLPLIVFLMVRKIS